jgi:hypothetical protein
MDATTPFAAILFRCRPEYKTACSQIVSLVDGTSTQPVSPECGRDRSAELMNIFQDAVLPDVSG